MNKAEEFARPVGLSAIGNKAYDVIMAELKKNCGDMLSTGGCRTFYSPKEWEERGEEYARGSELVVVYDGGDVRPFFSMDAAYDLDMMLAEHYRAYGKSMPADYKPYRRYEAMREKLAEVKVYPEEGTGWYSGIYKA